MIARPLGRWCSRRFLSLASTLSARSVKQVRQFQASQPHEQADAPAASSNDRFYSDLDAESEAAAAAMSEEEVERRRKGVSELLESLSDEERKLALTILAEHQVCREFEIRSLAEKGVLAALSPRDVVDLMGIEKRDDRISRMFFSGYRWTAINSRKLLNRLNARFSGPIADDRPTSEVLSASGLWNNTIFIRIRCDENRYSRLARAWRFQDESPNVVIDCGLLDEPNKPAPFVAIPGMDDDAASFLAHNPKERRFLVRAIAQTCMVNRNLREPFCLTFSSMPPILRGLFKTFAGFNNLPPAIPDLLCDISDDTVLDTRPCFDRSRVVYITPSSRRVLSTIESDVTYMIPPQVSYRAQAGRARQLGVETARLPIDQYVKWLKGRKALQFHMMLNVLHEVRLTGDWRAAFLKFLPAFSFEHHVPLYDESLKRRGLMERKSSRLARLF